MAIIKYQKPKLIKIFEPKLQLVPDFEKGGLEHADVADISYYTGDAVRYLHLYVPDHSLPCFHRCILKSSYVAIKSVTQKIS